MKMKTTPLAVALTLAVLFSASIGMVLAAPPNMDEGSPWTWSAGNARFTELQNKDYSWGAIVGDGRWGWIVHGAEMTEGNFDGELEVKGLEPNSWFLVTLYSDDAATGALLGSVGYYGVDYPKPKWADIALFQTDAEGNAEIELPYTSPAIDPVFGVLSAPTLPVGDYVDVKVHVKFVGTGDAPDWGLVMSGGYYGYPWDYPGDPGKYAQDYNIYEMELLAFTIAG